MGERVQFQEAPSILSVDGYGDKIVTGRLWWGGEGTETAFKGLIQLISLVEPLLEKTQGGGADFRCKRFVRPEPAEAAVETHRSTEPTRGALATFRLRILFRQNTSWQGLVTWIEGQQEQRFRSFLELAMLLDSALCFAEENKNAGKRAASERGDVLRPAFCAGTGVTDGGREQTAIEA